MWRAPSGRPLKLRRSWPRAQPSRPTCRGPGRHLWALDASPPSTTSACPSWARGLLSAQWKPGYHGPACQGPQHPSKDFAKDQALQACRGSPSLARISMPGAALHAWRGLAKGFSSARDLSSRGHQAKGSARPPASRGFLLREASSVSATERTWALRPPQSRGRVSAR